ncbi:MAG TPA: DUF3108 domain-containing protein [Methylibium sp.]
MMGRRSIALALLALAVLLVHGLLLRRVGDQLASIRDIHPGPPHIKVNFVRKLALAAPPRAKPTPPQPAPRREARHTVHGPAPGASRPASQPEEAVSAPEPVTSIASASAASEAASGAIAAAASASAVEAAASSPGELFRWPPSTRLSYTLNGYYRGEVQGTAQVQWLHEEDHYQVLIDIYIGPRFAPLMSRHMSSDGLITPDGLAPRRYDQDTRVGFSSRRTSMELGADLVKLANGSRAWRPVGMQDSASQFVQLTYEFTVRPEGLRAGNRIAMPLALPRQFSVWIYEVVGEEMLRTPFGEVSAFHVKPLREPGGGDLVAEAWFAPQLQYLPVRFHIVQDAQSYVDLMIQRLPEQAAR